MTSELLITALAFVGGASLLLFLLDRLLLRRGCKDENPDSPERSANWDLGPSDSGGDGNGD